MKRPLLLLSLLLLFLAAPAENYPYRSDVLWVTVPNHSDWLYQTGERATIAVQFYKYGIPRDGVVRYTIGDDMLPADTEGEVFLTDGRASISVGTRRTPGFRDVKMTVEADGKTYSHHVKVGFSVDEIVPWTCEPHDFSAFWQQTLDDYARYPLRYTRERYEPLCTDALTCDLVRIYVDRSHSIYGYLFMPRDARPGAHAVELCPPGAGVKSIKGADRRNVNSEHGIVRLEMEIHGLDPRMDDATFATVSAAFGSSDNGYFSNGIESRERYYLRHVYASLVKGIDFLTSLPEWDGRNVVVQGGSQGGALALVAAALDSRVTLCVANHPAMADMAASVEKGRTAGYPHFKADVLTEKAIETLAYYDVVNFARHITCPVRMTWGYNDNTCPPTTSYAVWNTLSCPKEALITPINEHWTSNDTERSHCDWILPRLK